MENIAKIILYGSLAFWGTSFYFVFVYSGIFLWKMRKEKLTKKEKLIFSLPTILSGIIAIIFFSLLFYEF